MYNVPAMKEKTYFIQIDGYSVEEEDFDNGCTGVIVNDSYQFQWKSMKLDFQVRGTINSSKRFLSQMIDNKSLDPLIASKT